MQLAHSMRTDAVVVAARAREQRSQIVFTRGRGRDALGELAALHRAAVVVEDRYSQIFKLDRVRPALVADDLAEAQVRWPNVPIVFCETRQLAEEYTYRFLGAAHTWAAAEPAASTASASTPQPTPTPPPRHPRHRRPRPPRSAPGPERTGSPSPPGVGCAPRSTKPGTPPTNTPTTNPAAYICPTNLQTPSLCAHGRPTQPRRRPARPR
jgi:hypothetical protein